MFKFGFSSEDNENEIDAESEEKDLVVWYESEEINPNQVTITKNVDLKVMQVGEISIQYISDANIVQSLQSSKLQNENSSLLNAEQNHSDLITAVYEGGLKIWECTLDLLHFLVKQEINFTNKKVLDLGCGAGILGIFACLNGAETVFQDYNSEVLKLATIPNVSFNNITFDKCKFYCGDWQSFLTKQKEKMNNEKFDYIFTSETIYNINNYGKIINIFKHLLQKNGIAYLAAKYHYFGVGGSIGQFEDVLKKENIFNYETCWTCTEGVKRAIIKITLK